MEYDLRIRQNPSRASYICRKCLFWRKKPGVGHDTDLDDDYEHLTDSDDDDQQPTLNDDECHQQKRKRLLDANKNHSRRSSKHIDLLRKHTEDVDAGLREEQKFLRHNNIGYKLTAAHK